MNIKKSRPHRKKSRPEIFLCGRDFELGNPLPYKTKKTQLSVYPSMLLIIRHFALFYPSTIRLLSVYYPQKSHSKYAICWC